MRKPNIRIRRKQTLHLALAQTIFVATALLFMNVALANDNDRKHPYVDAPDIPAPHEIRELLTQRGAFNEYRESIKKFIDAHPEAFKIPEPPKVEGTYVGIGIRLIKANACIVELGWLKKFGELKISRQNGNTVHVEFGNGLEAPGQISWAGVMHAWHETQRGYFAFYGQHHKPGKITGTFVAHYQPLNGQACSFVEIWELDKE